MSEKEYVKELKGITPTFTSVLNMQLGSVIQALNMGPNLETYRRLKNLIALLPEDKTKTLWENDIPHIEKGIDEINDISAVDYETTRIKRMDHARSLGPQIMKLFRHTIQVLHNNDYLEMSKVIPKSRFKG